MITDYIARRRWPFPLIITAATVLAYANSLHVPLHLDDTSAITNNPSIQRLWPPWELLLPPAHVTTGGRPFANLSFAFNHALAGTNVLGRNADAAAKFEHTLRLDPNHAAARNALAQLQAARR